MAYWLMVASEESFAATVKSNKLAFYGDVRGYNLISQTSIGDFIIFYITKKKIIKGVFKIASAPYLDESPMYGDLRDLSWNQRVDLTAIDSEASIDFPRISLNMDLVRDKRVSYQAYLVRTLVPLSFADFGVITRELGTLTDN